MKLRQFHQEYEDCADKQQAYEHTTENCNHKRAQGAMYSPGNGIKAHDKAHNRENATYQNFSNEYCLSQEVEQW
jgi:hypothetical protein